MITFSEQQIKDAAQDLYNAEKAHIQIAPLTESYPNMTMDDAYEVQSAWVKMKQKDGDRLLGYKIGLTSKVMQRAMKIDVPDYGVLLESMDFTNGSEIKASDFSDPRVEVELAFVLKNRLQGDNVTIKEVLAATDYVVPAIELIAARSYRVNPQSGYIRKVFDTIADNAANGGIICGSQTFDPNDLDLRWCGAILTKNNDVEETGLAAGVLDHPANGICWIAKRFNHHGIALEPSQILLSGSFTAPVAVAAGDAIRADYGPLGVVHINFV